MPAPVRKSAVAAHRNNAHGDAERTEDYPKYDRRSPAEAFGHRTETVGRYRTADICAGVEYPADCRGAAVFREAHGYERDKQVIYRGDKRCKEREEYDAQSYVIATDKVYPSAE